MIADESAAPGRLLTFRVGRGRYAVALEDVLGVQDVVVAGDGDDVTFHGGPVKTVQARRLGWGGADASAWPLPPVAVVVGKEGAGPTALVVDRVEGIVEGAEIRPLPELVSSFVRGVFRGVALHGDGWRLVVDPAALAGAAGKAAAESVRGGPGEA